MYQVALEVRPIAQVQHSAHLLSLRINSRDEFRNSQQIEHRAHRRGAARALRAAHALAALLLAQRLVQALAQRDGHVLRRVMIGDESREFFRNSRTRTGCWRGGSLCTSAVWWSSMCRSPSQCTTISMPAACENNDFRMNSRDHIRNSHAAGGILK